MATTKLDPKAVLAIANNVYKKLTSAKAANDNLFKAIKTSATGNGGKSYWKGNRAFVWYCTAVRNCANSYYRLYKVAQTYQKMCKSAQNAIMADKVMNTSEQSTYDGLGNKKLRFSDLMSSCEKQYSSVVTWGKS